MTKLPTKLYDTFGSTIERIKRQPEDLAQQAMKILTWIHLAERPLSVNELLHALATELYHNDIDYDNFPSRSAFLNCCLGLAITDDETSTVRLVHYSLEEYFKTQTRLFARGHEMIAEVCLTYLMFDSCMSTPERISRILWEETKPGVGGMLKLPELALLAYASCEWGHHARKGYPMEERAASMTLKYLSKGWNERMYSTSYLCRQIIKTTFIRYENEFVYSFTSLHIAAFFGIYQALPDIHSVELKFDSQDGIHGRTPLSWAAANGHEAVVKLLLGKGANIDSKSDYYSQTPLSLAAANGHKAVVKLLLEKGADVDFKDSFRSRRPLSWAEANAHEAVVSLLQLRR